MLFRAKTPDFTNDWKDLICLPSKITLLERRGVSITLNWNGEFTGYRTMEKYLGWVSAQEGLVILNR